jgi:PAS domain S-box-containing protein
MRWYRDISIRQKLQGIVMVTCGVALLAASVVFAFYDRATFLSAKTQDLIASAKMIGSNSTAAITFRDPKSAVDILTALRANEHVVNACIYDADGKVFAKYSRDSTKTQFLPPPPRKDQSAIVARHMDLFQAITLNNEFIGTIYIEADLQDLDDRFIRFAEIASIVLLASLAVAFLMSSRLQRVISGPIQELAATALAVTVNENYSIRATKHGRDEIGSLFDQFNSMLDRIQHRDVALQKAHDELEQRVVERTSYLNALIENSPLAIMVLDPQKNIQLCNPAFEDLFQYTRQEVIGRPIDGLLASGETVVDAPEISGFMLEGKAVNVSTRRQRKDRSVVDVELHTVSLAVGHKTAGSLCIYQDISVRKRGEEATQRAVEAAEASSRAKSEFLANMSHEIRTPLNGVIGMTDLALDTELTPEQREYLETVKLSADSLLTVINDILDFSKIEAGKFDLEAIDFNLRDLLQATLKTLSLRADEKGLELLCEVAPEVPEVIRGDSNRLRQVIVNLVGNAIKFTHEGEVALIVQTDSQGGEDRILRFVVSDTGIGIPLEKQQLIFEPFTQADTSTTRKYGGTGLGLAISTRLVGMMGGKMWVESEIDRGTQLHFTTRVGVADAKAIEVGAIAPPEILRGVNVLVVDDNRTNRRILEGMLKRWEMKPTSVEGGEEALVQLLVARDEGQPYRLIVTDMHMPKMDGFTLVERIREKPELSSAIIMMLTSAGHRGEGARCQELGVAAYLLKPIRQSELREALARVLGAQEKTGAVPLITRFSLREARDPRAVLSVLLVEDNPVNQRLTTRQLEKRGHRVVLAVNGREALVALDNKGYDLVLMDLQMPEMGGLEATAVIREQEKGRETHQPVIALTAHAMTGDRERCLDAGMDGYLSKPIRPQELDELLQTYVALRIKAANASETAGFDSDPAVSKDSKSVTCLEKQ